MYCICCDKDNVKPYGLGYVDNIPEMTEEEYIWSIEEHPLDENGQKYYLRDKLVTNADNRMWDGGIVQIISAGYGSSFDTSQFVIAICDDCIKNKIHDASILHYGNYMHGGKWVKEDIDQSKQILRRRKNLDGLV